MKSGSRYEEEHVTFVFLCLSYLTQSVLPVLSLYLRLLFLSLLENNITSLHDHIIRIHSFIEGHLGWFHFVAIMNRVAVKMNM